MKITTALRNAIAATTQTHPTISNWLAIMASFGPEIGEAIEGIYTGEFGQMRAEIPTTGRILVAQWGYGRMEVAYIS